VATATDLLAVYLQDHHAGATAGLALARRTAGANEDTEYGPELERIAAEIAEDVESLERLMDRLGVRRDVVKDTFAWTGEKLGRLKRNGTWLAYSPLSRVVELEGLVVGVTGKLALWESLQAANATPLAGLDWETLAARARDQRERLDGLRRRAAAEALG
jgi:hypothetical protein